MTKAKKESTISKTEFALAWQMQVARDGSLITGAYRIAICLSQQLWPMKEGSHRYYSRKGQNFFAEEINVHRNTVQKWIANLIEKGHLEVVNRKGQGMTNYYMPVLKPGTVIASDDVIETAPEFDADLPEMAELTSFEEPQEAPLSARVELFDPQMSGRLEVLSEAELYELEERHKHTIEVLRGDFLRNIVNDDADDINSDLVYDVRTLFELYEHFSLSFPLDKRSFGEDMPRIDFLTLVQGGLAPSQLIIEAREYVRATRSGGQPLSTEMQWVRSRVQAEDAALTAGANNRANNAF